MWPWRPRPCCTTAGAVAAQDAGRRPLAVIGRDPRASGEFLEAAVVAGLARSGVDVLRLGVIPTPAVAYLTRELGADLGVVLSASHNPAPDNGIKLFGRGGVKLPDEVEDEIEAHWAVAAPGGAAAARRGFGRVTDATTEHETGTSTTCSPPWLARPSARTARARPLAGLTVVVDCAHGAACSFAPRAAAAGRGRGHRDRRRARTGDNINAGCRLHPPGDAGGRGRRSTARTPGIATTATRTAAWRWARDGEVLDGDQILAVLALASWPAGRAAPATPWSSR